MLLIYGVTEVAGAYGFIAAFVGGVAFRRYEHGHKHNKRIHEGAESVEKFGELAVVLLLGSMLTLDGLAAPGLSGWMLVPVLLLAIRPLAVAISMLGSKTAAPERAFVAWFGVRGVGSLYYVAIAIGVGVSLVVHGVTAAPLARRWLPAEALDPGISKR